ncbi:MAG: hypothetical protein PHQ23_04920 [Candidatus Wallbacteria bacterium]|nr:hypothetical protein [Candidatus Wallbacteria bacterium]
MKILLNGSELKLQAADHEAVPLLISDHLMKKGLVLDKISVSGTDYFQLEDIDWQLNQESTVEITAITPVMLCLSTIRDAVDYIERLISAFGTITECFRSDRHEEGARLLTSCISGIEWINEVIVKIEPVLGIDYGKLEVNGEKITDYFIRYSGILNQITEAYEAKDMFLTADLLEFELVPAFIGWQIMFNKIVHSHDSDEL